VRADDLHAAAEDASAALPRRGSSHRWGFAIYGASHDDYEASFLPTRLPVGTCEDALDTACGLYIGDPTA